MNGNIYCNSIYTEQVMHKFIICVTIFSDHDEKIFSIRNTSQKKAMPPKVCTQTPKTREKTG